MAFPYLAWGYNTLNVRTIPCSPAQGLTPVRYLASFELPYISLNYCTVHEIRQHHPLHYSASTRNRLSYDLFKLHCIHDQCMNSNHRIPCFDPHCITWRHVPFHSLPFHVSPMHNSIKARQRNIIPNQIKLQHTSLFCIGVSLHHNLLHCEPFIHLLNFSPLTHYTPTSHPFPMHVHTCIHHTWADT